MGGRGSWGKYLGLNSREYLQCLQNEKSVDDYIGYVWRQRSSEQFKKNLARCAESGAPYFVKDWRTGKTINAAGKSVYA